MGHLKGTGDEIDAKGVSDEGTACCPEMTQLSAERRGQIRGCGVMKPEDQLRRGRLAS